MKLGNTTQKLSFPFCKLRYCPFDKPRNFANICQIKWNRIKSMKFETVQIYFLSDFSVCCHSEICYHGNLMQLLLLSIGFSTSHVPSFNLTTLQTPQSIKDTFSVDLDSVSWLNIYLIWIELNLNESWLQKQVLLNRCFYVVVTIR